MLGAGGFGTSRPAGGAPDSIKKHHRKYWAVILVLLVSVFALEIMSVHGFDLLFAAIMASIVWYMIRLDCKHMNQYVLLIFALLCAIQEMFEVISIVSSISGRKVSHTSNISLGNGKATLTRTVETHPFFDAKQGFRYNVQSCTRIVSSVVYLLALGMSYWSYNKFPTSVFSMDSSEEVEPILAGRLAQRLNPAGGAYPSDAAEGEHAKPQRVFVGTSVKLGQLNLQAGAKVPASNIEAISPAVIA
jgi:hypothetical protein